MVYDILIYLGDSTNKQPLLEDILTTLHLRYFIVHDDLLHQTVGYLFNLYEEVPIQARTQVSFDMDFMVFNNVSDKKIIDINENMKKKGIEMKCKAMLTKHNINWALKDLLNEIEQEHKYFMLLEEINAILTSSSELIIEQYTPTSWKSYEKAFYQSYDCLQKQEPFEIVEKRLATLKQARKQLILK